MAAPAGRRIIAVSWASNVVFALTAVPAALGVAAFDPVAAATALVLFAVSLVVWVWAFAVAAARSTQGDDIAVGNLFLFEGDAPKVVRRHLFGSVALSLATTALTAKADPFGVLVPMLPVGLVGLWGARHGVFPRRRDVVTPDRPLRPSRAASGRSAKRRSGNGRAGE
jgi:hypothetical protein